MTTVRIRGFKIFKDRYGKQRCYHRNTGTPIDLERMPIGSAAFIAECDRITKATDLGLTAKAGTLGLLIKEYRQSDEFLDLKPRTKNDYLKVLDYLQPIADMKLSDFDTSIVVKIRDKASRSRGRRFGKYVHQVLSIIFGWGRERGFISENPAKGIRGLKKPKDAEQANRPWSSEECVEVLKALPPHLKPAIALMMFCGLDPQDALSLPKDAIAAGQINTARGKTSVEVWMPLPALLRELLKSAPRHSASTVCANSLGRTWTVSGFRASWRRIKLQLEEEEKIKPHLTLKGLRHTVATILSEMGKDPETIRLMLGQKTDAMARHYSSRANHKRRMEETVSDFDIELEKRTATVKLSEKPVKLAGLEGNLK